MVASSKKNTAKPVADVVPPGESPPSATAKPVIVLNHAPLRDPMMSPPSSEGQAEPEAAKPVLVAPSVSKKVISPLIEVPSTDAVVAVTVTPKDTPRSVPTAADSLTALPIVADRADDKDEDSESAQTASELTAVEVSEPETMPGKEIKTALTDKEAARVAAEAAAHQKELQKLIENKKYFLPINPLEARKAHRFVILGVSCSLLLAIAWLDIALDANLIHIAHLHALTHFFH